MQRNVQAKSRYIDLSLDVVEELEVQENQATQTADLQRPVVQ